MIVKLIFGGKNMFTGFMFDELSRRCVDSFESYKRSFGITEPSGINDRLLFSCPFAERMKRYDIIGEPKTKLEIFETLANWFNHTAKFKTITRTGAHVQEITEQKTRTGTDYISYNVFRPIYQADQLHENNAVIIWGLNDGENKIIFDYCFGYGRF